MTAFNVIRFGRYLTKSISLSYIVSNASNHKGKIENDQTEETRFCICLPYINKCHYNTTQTTKLLLRGNIVLLPSIWKCRCAIQNE